MAIIWVVKCAPVFAVRFSALSEVSFDYLTNSQFKYTVFDYLLIKKLEAKKHAAKIATKILTVCLWSVTERSANKQYLSAPKSVLKQDHDSTSCQIGVLLRALKAFRHARLTNSQNSALLFLQHVFCVKLFDYLFLTVYFGIVLLIFLLIR